MSTIKVDTIATRTGSGNITASNTIAGTSATLSGTLGVTGATSLAGTTVSSSTLNMSSSLMQFSGNISLPNVGACLFRPSADTIAFGINNGQRVSVNQHGLLFGTDTAASNALDDYEEGTYTPVLASTGCTFSYSVQLGSYVKVGNLVYLQFNITLSNRTGTLSNTVFIDNIPFLTKNVDNSLYSGGHIGHYFNVNLGSGTTMAYQIPAVSTNQLELKEVGDNLGENGIVASELNTNAVIRGSVVYRAAT